MFSLASKVRPDPFRALTAQKKLRHNMTIPYERTRALVYTLRFLRELQDPQLTPRVPRWVRGHAKALERHYPTLADIELAHTASPEWYGPVKPFLHDDAPAQRLMRPGRADGK
jgi:hypothetical protein